MHIPVSFYIRFWLLNTCLASATGVVLILLLPIYSIVGFWSMMIAPCLYQFIMFKIFFGNRRGDFEYEYKLYLTDAHIRSAVLHLYGIRKLTHYILDQTSQLSSASKDIILGVLKGSAYTQDMHLEADIYIKLAELYSKDEDYEKERSFLGKAVEVQPHGLIANFRLAVSFEKSGNAESAIKHYKSALQDPSLTSNQLKEFITSHISRVVVDGPREKPPLPGLRYLTW